MPQNDRKASNPDTIRARLITSRGWRIKPKRIRSHIARHRGGRASRAETPPPERDCDRVREASARLREAEGGESLREPVEREAPARAAPVREEDDRAGELRGAERAEADAVRLRDAPVRGAAELELAEVREREEAAARDRPAPDDGERRAAVLAPARAPDPREGDFLEVVWDTRLRPAPLRVGVVLGMRRSV